MKKFYGVVLMTCALVHAEIKIKKTSQSYYFNQPLFNSLGIRFAGWRNILYSLEHNTAFHIVGAGTKSYHSSGMSEYFLLGNKKSLIIRGSAAAKFSDLSTDIRAEYVGLTDTFDGELSIKPSYESAGVLLGGRILLKDAFSWSFFQRASLFFQLPIVQAKTNMHFEQKINSDPIANTQPIHDIFTAFNNPAWKYQKIKTTAQKITRLADMRVGLANSFMCNDRALVAYSTSAIIPTTNQYKNEYMFEPQPGFQGFPGWATTVHMNVPLTTEGSSFYLSFFADAEHTWLIRTKQLRTFDLKTKQWSRFLPVQKEATPDSVIPGVNVLTRKVRVSPYSVFDALVGFHIKAAALNLEIAFGAWGHPTSRIKFTDEWNSVYGIAGTTDNTSTHTSTIKIKKDNDDTFTPIYESDLDIDSASSPAMVLYKAHAALSIEGIGQALGGFANIIMQIQIPRNKTCGFRTWSLAGSFGCSF